MPPISGLFFLEKNEIVLYFPIPVKKILFSKKTYEAIPYSWHDIAFRFENSKKKTQQNERETLVQLKPDMKEEKGKGRLRMLT